MSANSKGKDFERKIAKLFSKRFKSRTGIDNSFMRNLTGSGAFFGGKNAHRAKTVSDKDLNTGDIVTPLNFNYTIECKHYKTPPSFGGIVKQKILQWDKWIDQVMTDSKTSGKKPLLIVKYNLIPEILLVPETDTSFYSFTPLMWYTTESYGIWSIFDFNKVLNDSPDEIWFS